MNSLTFTVLGVAQTKGSTKAFTPKGWKRPIITNDNPKAKGWASLIAAGAAAALASAEMQPFAAGPVSLEIWFHLPRPQKFLSKRYADADVPHVTRPDADKLLRCAKDALSRVLWHDDAQVVDAHVYKRYCAVGTMPRAVITVMEASRPILGLMELRSQLRSIEHAQA
jgi:Holliday junction resolvase RusA-like endonuclease